ncbi:MAG: type II toxin-antitoxin system VapC family toxin [Crocinitomicaceae bacterium]|nr:type II toxin-antitoxin system VapC family toxin [Crocinitomicaceae bacterium]
MSGTKLFVDTNIILSLLNGDETLSEFLNGRQFYISFVTELELLGFPGLSEKERKTIQSFLSHCKITDLNKSIKEEVIRLRSAYKLKLPDAIVLASAIYHDLPLITADKDFKKAESELNLIYYSR